MYLILFVLHDADKCERLLDAWEKAGVRGATILHSTGLGRMRGKNWTDDLPLFPSLEALTEHEEYFSRTFFTVVDTENIVDRLVECTESVVGDLSQPETGFLVVLPVLRTYGFTKHQ
jgi:nitrogen regulatory protein P-II 1